MIINFCLSSFVTNFLVSAASNAAGMSNIKVGLPSDVMSAFGSLGSESSCFVPNLAEKIAEKQGMESSVVANYVRSKMSFELKLLCGLLSSIRGSRSKKSMSLGPKKIKVVNSATEIME